MQSRMIINVLAPAMHGLRVFANTSPLISTTGINRGLGHVKCVEVLVRRSSPVRKLASTRLPRIKEARLSGGNAN